MRQRFQLALFLGAAASYAVAQTPPPPQLGALAPANIAKSRPKPPFDLTGTWQHGGGQNNGFRFSPPEGFKLTPAAQAKYDASLKASAAGKVYQDDIGNCWPAGLPVIMTRVWPIATIQLPTAIYMISGFENEIRMIYLDGRKFTPEDEVVRTYDGESIGHWEGDTLVVETRSMTIDKHVIDDGLPVSDQFRIIERIRLINNGSTMEDKWTLIDPKNWEGEWTSTHWWKRQDDTDITEVQCLPDTNSRLPATGSKGNILK